MIFLFCVAYICKPLVSVFRFCYPLISYEVKLALSFVCCFEGSAFFVFWFFARWTLVSLFCHILIKGLSIILDINSYHRCLRLRFLNSTWTFTGISFFCISLPWLSTRLLLVFLVSRDKKLTNVNQIYFSPISEVIPQFNPRIYSCVFFVFNIENKKHMNTSRD